MFAKAILVALLAFCFYEKGFGYDEVLRCPDPFRPEKVNTLIYQVNTTAIKEAKCELATNWLTISVDRNKNFDTVCNIRYKCSSPGPVRDPTKEELQASCGCASISGDMWTFEVKLYVDKEKDTGAKFGFNLCNGAENPPSQHIQESCKSISIVAEKDRGLGTTLIVVIVVVVVLVVVGAIAGIVFFVRKRGFRGMPVRT